jgi:beta-phosphoglucomutase
MTEKPVKAIIFDMDGVLVNSEPHHKIIERRLFSRLNILVSEEEHRSYLGKSSVQMWKEIISKHNLSHTAEELSEINSKAIIKYFSELHDIDLIPGISDLLKELYGKRIPMALASSSEPEIIDIFLSMTDLNKYFVHKVSCEIVGKSKPEPDVYLHTARLMSVSPDECLAVEDSPSGIKAAKSANMFCVAYKGAESKDLNLSMADEVIDNISALPEILEKYMSM